MADTVPSPALILQHSLMAHVSAAALGTAATHALFTHIEQGAATCEAIAQRAGLSLREFELLKFFVTHPHRVYDRLQLLDLVWGRDVHVEPRTVDVHVRRLRKHIEKNDAEPELIVTVRGVGYKFDPDALDR